MRLVALAGVSVAVTALGACAEPPALELPPVSWEGDHLRVATDAEFSLCGGTAPYMDRLLGRLGEQLGAPLSRRPVYYLLDGELTDYETPCDSESYGCSDGAAAYTQSAPLDHELVHLARSAIDFSYPLIEEGAAEYWGDDTEIRSPLQGDVLDIAARGKDLDFPVYPRAGHFVAYLVDAYGEAAFHDVSLRTTYSSTFNEFRDALVDVYGLGLEALVEDYEANYPECPQLQYRAAFGDCAFAPARRLCDGETALVVRRSFSCEDDDVIGPRFGRSWTMIPIEIDEAGPYSFVFSATPADDVTLTLRPCGGGCPPAGLGPFSPSETVRLAILEAGPHVIKIDWPAGDPIDVDLDFLGCSR
jgi:hypothetical protein